ncbi:MAG: hypothetical protein ACKOA4_00760, partial [Haliscomenobacter sp.]
MQKRIPLVQSKAGDTSLPVDIGMVPTHPGPGYRAQLVAILCLAVPFLVFTQPPVPAKIGLTLSGGGAK